MFKHPDHIRREGMSFEEVKKMMEAPTKKWEIEELKDLIYTVGLFTAANTLFIFIIFIMIAK